MQIICEFCGAAVNIQEDDICPNCGASYADNVQYQERKKLELEKEKLEIKKKKTTYEKRQAAAKRQAEEKRKQKTVATWMITIIALFFLAPMIVGFFIGMYEGITGENIFQDETNIEYEDVEILEPSYQANQGNFDEFVYNGVYSVSIDKIQECNREYYTPKKGYMFVEVHFVITNSSNEECQVWERNVNCIVNGFVQERCWDSNYHEITSDYISPGLSVDGWEIFEIPINAQTIEIKYGDYITINIDPKNITILNTEE